MKNEHAGATQRLGAGGQRRTLTGQSEEVILKPV